MDNKPSFSNEEIINHTQIYQDGFKGFGLALHDRYEQLKLTDGVQDPTFKPNCKKSIKDEINMYKKKYESKQFSTKAKYLTNLKNTRSEVSSVGLTTPARSHNLSQSSRKQMGSKIRNMSVMTRRKKKQLSGGLKTTHKDLLEQLRIKCKFHSKYKFDQIILNSSLLNFYKAGYYQKQRINLNTSVDDAQAQNPIKPPRYKQRVGSVDDKTTSYFTDKINPDNLQIPPLHIKSVRESRKYDPARTFNDTESVSVQQSPRGYTMRSNEGRREKMLYTAHNSPRVTEISANYDKNQGIELEKYQEVPITSNTVNLKTKKAPKLYKELNKVEDALDELEMKQEVNEIQRFASAEIKLTNILDKQETIKTILSKIEKKYEASGIIPTDTEKLSPTKPDTSPQDQQNLAPIVVNKLFNLFKRLLQTGDENTNHAHKFYSEELKIRDEAIASLKSTAKRLGAEVRAFHEIRKEAQNRVEQEMKKLDEMGSIGANKKPSFLDEELIAYDPSTGDIVYTLNDLYQFLKFDSYYPQEKSEMVDDKYKQLEAEFVEQLQKFQHTSAGKAIKMIFKKPKSKNVCQQTNLRDYEAEIENLTTELAISEQKRNHLKIDNNKLMNEVTKWKNEVKMKSSEVLQLRKDIQRVSRNLKGGQIDYRYSSSFDKAENIALQKKIDQYKEMLSKTERHMKDAVKNLEDTRKAKDIVVKNLNSLIKNVEFLEGNLRIKEGTVKKLRKNLSEIRDYLNKQNFEVDKHETIGKLILEDHEKDDIVYEDKQMQTDNIDNPIEVSSVDSSVSSLLSPRRMKGSGKNNKGMKKDRSNSRLKNAYEISIPQDSPSRRNSQLVVSKKNIFEQEETKQIKQKEKKLKKSKPSSKRGSGSQQSKYSGSLEFPNLPVIRINDLLTPDPVQSEPGTSVYEDYDDKLKKLRRTKIKVYKKLNELGQIDHRWIQTDPISQEETEEVKVIKKNAFTQKPDRKERQKADIPKNPTSSDISQYQLNMLINILHMIQSDGVLNTYLFNEKDVFKIKDEIIEILRVHAASLSIGSIWMNYSGASSLGGPTKASELYNIGQKDPVLHYIKKEDIIPEVVSLVSKSSKPIKKAKTRKLRSFKGIS
ncbi:unnamed protein product [Moneuplotes crassus]|uniref:Uncharacterized protein n=2 Tax=Euplotes crassus TaxID=5936 RepID=A0AAD1UEN0_EUPCR|nr:unnamed protein product [Moneuplotes crassus]